MQAATAVRTRVLCLGQPHSDQHSPTALLESLALLFEGQTGECDRRETAAPRIGQEQCLPPLWSRALPRNAMFLSRLVRCRAPSPRLLSTSRGYATGPTDVACPVERAIQKPPAAIKPEVGRVAI